MITVQRAAKAVGKHLSRLTLKARTALGAAKDRHCPACRCDVAGFFRYGDCAEWGCPSCGASPRERLMHWLMDEGALSLPAHASILHMAPNEGSLVRRLKSRSEEHTSELQSH